MGASPSHRRPGDPIRVAVGVGVLAGTAVLAHSRAVGTTEKDLFQLVNDLPAAFSPLLSTISLAGSLAAVPVAAAVALSFRRFRLAAETLLAGAGAWVLAAIARHAAGRPRPATLLPGVHLHGAPAGGAGYPSSHAAVIFALVTALSPYLGRRVRRVLWPTATLVCVGRVYLGAHLPLDVVGGAALGWAVATAVLMLLGAPDGWPTPTALRRALLAYGLRPVAVKPLEPSPRHPIGFHVVTATGEQYFVKMMTDERRDSHALDRLRRRLTGSGQPPEGSAEQRLYHEATMTLLAREAGARVPSVVGVRAEGDGSALLIRSWVEARTLNRIGLDDLVLSDVWRQVSRLHSARLAHGDLRLGNMLVDRDGRAWLLGFAHATCPAESNMLDRDVRALLSTLADVVGLPAAVAAAADGLDPDRLRSAVRQLSPGVTIRPRPGRPPRGTVRRRSQP